MTQTFADELFNNLSKLKGCYKLNEEKTITLDGSFKDSAISSTLYFYGLDYSIGSGANKGNFIIGEKVAEIIFEITTQSSTIEETKYLTLNFNDGKITGVFYDTFYDSWYKFTNENITSKVFYSVSHPYPALFIITSINFDKNDTYSSNLNNAINEINTDILNEGIIYTVPEFVREE